MFAGMYIVHFKEMQTLSWNFFFFDNNNKFFNKIAAQIRKFV